MNPFQPVDEQMHLLMRGVDELYLATPFYGARKMAVELKKQSGLTVNRKRVRRLMQFMGIRPDFA